MKKIKHKKRRKRHERRTPGWILDLNRRLAQRAPEAGRWRYLPSYGWLRFPVRQGTIITCFTAGEATITLNTPEKED